MRRPLLPALRALYPSWTVEWALHGNADLANALHLDCSAVFLGKVEEGFDPNYPLADDVLLDDEYDTTLTTVRWTDGTVFDYTLSYLLSFILSP